ncbi:MAG: FHA domain-containing protein, partial [Myxococcaceae bacterium]
SRGAPAVDPEAKARKKKLLLIGAAAAVVILGGLAVARMVVESRNSESIAQQQEQRKRLGEFGAIFQDGKNLVRDGKWVDAKAKFEELLAVAPQYPGVKDYLDRANVEVPNQQHLEAAEAALVKNHLSEAAASLGKVTQDTQQFEKHRELKNRLGKKLDERLVEATAAMSASEFEKAVEITEDILRVWPEHRDASVLHEDAKAAIARRDAPKPQARPQAPKPWQDVVERYVDGDMSGALTLADPCASSHAQCRTLAAKIRQFAELYKKVESLDAKGLSRLLELDREISGGRRSKMARAAGTRAAGLFYKNASAAKNMGHWGRALDWASQALEADPGHSGAKAIADEARSQAYQVYMSAYQLKDTSPDEAVLKFREVLKMTAPGDEYHGKAKNWIEKLAR